MGTKSPQSAKKSVKSLGCCYSLPLTDRHCWQDLSKLLKDGLHSIEKCDLLNKNKVQCIYFGLFPNYHGQCKYMRYQLQNLKQ